MAMRRKEKTLTMEEVKEKLHTQTTEQWLHSEPLLGTVPTTEGVKLIPLTESAEQNILIVFLLNLGNYSTEIVNEIISQWKAEYSELPWKSIIAYQPNTLFLKIPKFLDRYRSSTAFNSTAYFADIRGEWFDLFHTSDEPTVLILHHGNVVYKEGLGKDFFAKIEKTEKQFQEILRTDDPGLPLAEVSQRSSKRTPDLQIITPEQITPVGNWIQGGGAMMSEDSAASLKFAFEGQRLRLVASPHPQARENCRLTVSFNDEPLNSVRYGDQVHQGDRGNAVCELNRTTGFYEIIESDSVLKGTVTLKFLNALENPVIIYSLRSS